MQTIDIKDLRFSYHTEEETGKPHEVLRGVSMSIDKGSYVAVLGPNGSGKSTLAKLIDILETPDSGTIVIFGNDSADTEKFWDIRSKCACVFQNPDNQIVGTVVEEDVAFGPENLGVPNPELRERVDRALKAVGLYEKRFMQAANLSGGQKQKLAIAGALAMKPDILILDEATAMLDPVSRREFLTLIEDIRDRHGITVITITHDMEEAARCEKIFVIRDGVIAGSGTPTEVFSDRVLIHDSGLDRPVHYKFVTACHEQLGMDPEGGSDLNDEKASAELVAHMILNADDSGEIEDEEPVQKEDTPSGESIVQIRDLSFNYDEGSFKLQDIDLDIYRSEILAIIGKSGCGKTTLISHLNALISPMHGQVLIKKGEETLDASVKKDVRKIRTAVGLLFQYPEYQLFEETVYKDVEYGLKKMGIPEEERPEMIREAIRLVGLPDDVINKSPFEISGGQKRRVAMAGVLVMKPEILVLDEPASGMDPKGRREMFKLIRSLRRKGNTIVLVTHNMDEGAAIADRVCCIGDGRILSVADPTELFRDSGKCREMGIDIPKITAFSQKVKDIISGELPGIEFGEIYFDARKEVRSIRRAVRTYREAHNA
ncbi:MAG: ATP-binding cassette domain-containing protein [Clostridiales bacterium]|nr:ATP-binding cassette domain-containing protein [Clostridiales bacterium]